MNEKQKITYDLCGRTILFLYDECQKLKLTIDDAIAICMSCFMSLINDRHELTDDQFVEICRDVWKNAMRVEVKENPGSIGRGDNNLKGV